jgi:hypothetical protein
MACSCRDKKASDKFKIKLPGGMTITRNTEAEATAYAAKHPGATVTKVPART